MRTASGRGAVRGRTGRARPGCHQAVLARRRGRGLQAARRRRSPPLPPGRCDRRRARPLVPLRPLPALPRRRLGQGRGDDPQRRQRQRSGRPARRKGRDRQLDPVPGPGHPRRQALRSLPRPLHPGPRDELRRRHRRPHQAAGQARHHGDDPRGLQPLAGGAAGRRRRPRRRLRQGDRPLQVPRPGPVRRQGRPEPGGLPLPGHLRTEAGRAHRRPGPAAAAGLRAADQGREHGLRPLQEPDHLRRADDRLDDRARGGGRRASASWSPRSSTTACTKGCRWGSTRRSALPPATTKSR